MGKLIRVIKPSHVPLGASGSTFESKKSFPAPGFSGLTAVLGSPRAARRILQPQLPASTLTKVFLQHAPPKVTRIPCTRP